MIESIKRLVVGCFINPIKNEPTFVLFLIGVLLIFFGGGLGELIGRMEWAPKGVGEMLMKTGGAILGGGVFAAIMKSAQFANLFQQHIADVIYHPENAFRPKGDDWLKEVKGRWLILTKGIFKRTLPQAYNNAAEQIMAQFLDSDLDFHFEDYDLTCDIKVTPGSNQAMIRNTVRSRLIIAPHTKNPTIRQTLAVNGQRTLEYLTINGDTIDTTGLFTPSATDPSESIFEYSLKSYLKTDGRSGDYVVHFERAYKFSQDLSSEPYLLWTMTRFVKGCTVKGRVSGGYRLFFKKTGAALDDSIEAQPAERGYTRWNVASQNDLMLPGQGFIVIVVPS